MICMGGRDETYLARDRGSLADLLVRAGSPSVSFDELVELFKTIPFDELVKLYEAGEWWDREEEPGVRVFHQLVRDGTMPYPVVDCLEDGIGCLLLPDSHTYTSIRCSK